jgi:hypothetical protein
MYGESTNTNEMQPAARRLFADLTFDPEYQWLKALGIDGPNDETVTDRRNIRYDYGNWTSMPTTNWPSTTATTRL